MTKKHKWTENDIPNMTGKVVIVTGANSGIGYDTTRALAQKGATLIMACRNLQKANAAAEQIQQTNPAGTLEVMPLDLGDLESVRHLAADFQAKYERLDLLINNAGIMIPPYGKTAQGFESQFGVNHLGHFALTGLLLPMLNATSQARVVTVSSTTHRFGKINFDDLNWEQKYNPSQAYSQSKLANLLFTYELQRKLTAAGQETLATAAHPGWTTTNLQGNSRLMTFFSYFLGQSSAMGALPTLYAAVASDVKGADYFGPGDFMEMRGHPKKVPSNDRSHDQAVARRLWNISEELTGVVY